MVPRRRRLAIGFLIAALATAVVSAADAGYHVGGDLGLPDHRGGHVHLHGLGNPPEIGFALALGLLVVAGHYAIPRQLRIAGAVVTILIPLLLVFAFLAQTALESTFGESGGSTVATSDRYALVRYARSELLRSDHLLFYVRARKSLVSYETDTAVACFIDPRSFAGPQWLFATASLTDDQVHVVARDGTSWDVRFDPVTLRPANPVDRCTDAPDLAGD
jgi:hypothetical protein